MGRPLQPPQLSPFSASASNWLDGDKRGKEGSTGKKIRTWKRKTGKRQRRGSWPPGHFVNVKTVETWTARVLVQMSCAIAPPFSNCELSQWACIRVVELGDSLRIHPHPNLFPLFPFYFPSLVQKTKYPAGVYKVRWFPVMLLRVESVRWFIPDLKGMYFSQIPWWLPNLFATSDLFLFNTEECNVKHHRHFAWYFF